MHQCLAYFVLSAVVASDDWANGISEERIEEGFAVVGGKWIECDRNGVMFFLWELPICLHAYYERINAKTKNIKRYISLPSLKFFQSTCDANGIIEFNNNGKGHFKRLHAPSLQSHQIPPPSLPVPLPMPLRVEID